MDLGSQLHAAAAGDVSPKRSPTTQRLEKHVEGDRDKDEDERQDQRLILGPAEILPPPIENADVHGGMSLMVKPLPHATVPADHTQPTRASRCIKRAKPKGVLGRFVFARGGIMTMRTFLLVVAVAAIALTGLSANKCSGSSDQSATQLPAEQPQQQPPVQQPAPPVQPAQPPQQ